MPLRESPHAGLPDVAEHPARRMQTAEQIRQWFETVVRENYRLLFATAYRILRNPQDAEDAAQTAVLKAFANLGSIENPQTIVAWLSRIVRHCAIDMLKSGYRTHARLVGDDQSQLDRFQPPPSTAVAEDDRQVLLEEIEKLPDGQSQVITLRHLEGLDVEQIARRLGITANTARVRLFRAYERLRTNGRIRAALGMEA